MSFYCIYMGEPGMVQPIMQPLMNASIINNSKLTAAASDFGGSSGAPVMCNKVLAPSSTFLLPNDGKFNWNSLTNSLSGVVVGGSSSSSLSNQPKMDTSRHFHIFVGDLSPDVETHHLREAFSQFGQTSDCKIIRDQQTLKSKGYGFVSFVNKEDAEAAIGTMNGQWIGSRAVRTNWASRKPPTQIQKEAMQKPLTYDEVFTQSSPTNCTVYCGGIVNGQITEELMQKTFSSYGCIQEIRVFKEKGYAFVRFSTKESASQAIVGVHGTEILGNPVKCSWGKEPNESPGNSPTQQTTFAPLTLQSGYCGGPLSTTAQAYYNQLGSSYWSLPSAAAYPPQLVHPTGYVPIQPPIQHHQPMVSSSSTQPVPAGYTYASYGRVPGMQQWPTSPLTATPGGSQVLPYTTTHPTLLAYPAQSGFQQA